MDWTSKKFTFTIINQHGEKIGQMYDLLVKLESFALKSEVVIDSIERTGNDDFKVHVHCKDGWLV
jgi:hypothetical protein